MPPTACPLCGSDAVRPAARAHGRDYFACEVCALAFLSPAQRLSPTEERARYEQHENDPADARYRTFLARLAAPLMAHLQAGATGLDYGAGPGPALSVMLEEAGFPTAIYDPFFAPDPGPLSRTYDFVTCTETFEHFFAPARELEQLDALLRPGGWLAVMTELRDGQDLEKWWYVRDPTHVCFYAAQTLEWIAASRGWRLERPRASVALFHKP
ncbi:MAG TPA: class I SAM-dependent methyltransferase [Longimicrobiales bacterium]|nr:class I SAM-dependent methyltransferase [Longimicrobiales bacterium]